MNKYAAGIVFIVIATSSFAVAFTQPQEIMISRCNNYISHYNTLSDMPPDVAKKAELYLEFCYENHTCTTANCNRKLNLWKLTHGISQAAATPSDTQAITQALKQRQQSQAPQPSVAAPAPATALTPAQPVAQQPTSPTVNNADTTQQKQNTPKPQSINWF